MVRAGLRHSIVVVETKVARVVVLVSNLHARESVETNPVPVAVIRVDPPVGPPVGVIEPSL